MKPLQEYMQDSIVEKTLVVDTVNLDLPEAITNDEKKMDKLRKCLNQIGCTYQTVSVVTDKNGNLRGHYLWTIPIK